MNTLYFKLKQLAPLALLSFIISFVAPTTIYFFNSGEFQFPLYFHAGFFSVVFIIIFSVLFLLSLLGKPGFHLVIGFCVVLSATLLIRDFMFPSDSGLLDGRPRFDGAIIDDHSLWLFVATLALITALFLLKRKLIQDFLAVGGFLSLAFVAYVIATSYATITKKNASEDISPYFEISSTRNIIILSFDSIQNNVLAKVLKEHPKLANKFAGFTYFNDVSAVAPATIFSLLSTLTGTLPPTGSDSGSVSHVRNLLKHKSFLDHLGRNGYSVTTYGVPPTSPGQEIYSYQRVLESRAITRLESEELFFSGIIRVFPVSLSFDIADSVRVALTSLRAASQDRISNAIENDSIDPTFGMDYLGFRMFTQELELVGNPVAKFYHYLPTHQPLKFDRNCHYLGSKVASQSLKGAEEEVLCICSLLGDFVDKLKTLGVYDKSLLILTSDHGYGRHINPTIQVRNGNAEVSLGVVNKDGHEWWGTAGRYSPILMVKSFDASGALDMDSAPASLVDIAPTVCGQAFGDSGCSVFGYEGFDLVNNKPTSPRLRKIIVFEGGIKHEPDWLKETTYYKSMSFSGIASTDIPRLLRPLVPLECGETLQLSSVPVWDKIVTMGFAGNPTENGVWTDKDQAKILFGYSNRGCSHESLVIKSGAFLGATDAKVSAMIRLNGKPIGSLRFDTTKGNPRVKTISYPLPENALFTDKQNLIEFDIHGSNSPKNNGLSEDERMLGLRLMEVSVQAAKSAGH